MPFDQKNCALEDQCKCAKLMRSNAAKTHDIEYWTCSNWGRSTLAMPGLNHDSGHYSGVNRATAQKTIDDAQRRYEKHIKHSNATEDRLREIRHTDPKKHLRRKGIKI